MSRRGKYIVIEGNDGTGKSTQVERLEQRLLTEGIESIQIHEPDGTPISARLRTIIKDGTLERDGLTNILLFTAARHENWRQWVEPALASGKWVLSARNWVSTVAYQGYGENANIQQIESITREFVGESYMHPDLELILTLEDEDIRKNRIDGRGELEQPDTFESRSSGFQSKVNNGYIDFAGEKNLETIDASRDIDAVEQDIWQKVLEIMET